MGTTLTGTKPKDTYDSLIKVEDNGPISGTAKYLSDGLGNNLPIAVSTSNVGIGTSAPVSKLNVDGSITATGGVRTNPTGGGSIVLDYQTTGDLQGRVRSRDWDGALWKNITLEGANIIAAPSGTEVGRFTSSGLTFNGDTAAANALDDYEEGTFSPTIIGTTTAGTATYTEQNGRYTKIGRLVQFEIFMVYTGGTGTGNLSISNLPFTIGGLAYPSFTIGAFDNITMTALNIPLAWGNVSTANIRLAEMPVGGGQQASVAYDAAGAIQITGTYSV